MKCSRSVGLVWAIARGVALLAARPTRPVLAGDWWMKTDPLLVRLATIGTTSWFALSGLASATIALLSALRLFAWSELAGLGVATTTKGRDKLVYNGRRAMLVRLILLVAGFLGIGGPHLGDDNQ